MRHPFIIMSFAGALLATGAAAEDVPLPRPRPSPGQDLRDIVPPIFVAADLLSEPTACQIRIQAAAAIEPIVLLNGASGCGGDDMVRLKAVVMADNSRVAVMPPAELRCAMAETVARWLREDVAAKFTGPALRSVVNYESFECRPRNRILGAKMSEHGVGNALDVRAFKLEDGTVIDPTDVRSDRGLRESLRSGACGRFTTVLGPGSDGYHEAHIHLDIAARRGAYRICQWAVRDPTPEIASADVPLPRPRPVIRPDASPGNDKRKL